MKYYKISCDVLLGFLSRDIVFQCLNEDLKSSNDLWFKEYLDDYCANNCPEALDKDLLTYFDILSIQLLNEALQEHLITPIPEEKEGN